MDFYNFFSFSAKKAIYRASEICSQFKNQTLEPEHIFYSILNLRSCSAVQVLHQLGVNLPKLSYFIEAHLYENAGTFTGNAIFSQRTIALLDASYKEVRRLHHREIGTTHLLVALSQERSPFLRQLFEEHALDARKIRETFMAHLKGYDEGHKAAKPALSASGTAQASIQAEADPSFAALLDTEAGNILRFARRSAEQYRHTELLPLHVAFALSLTARTDEAGFFRRAGVHQGRLLSALVRLLEETEAEEEVPDEAVLESSALLDLITRAMRSALEQRRGIQQPRSPAAALQITARDLLYAVLQDPDEGLQSVLQHFSLSPRSLVAEATGKEESLPAHLELQEQDVEALLGSDPALPPDPHPQAPAKETQAGAADAAEGGAQADEQNESEASAQAEGD